MAPTVSKLARPFLLVQQETKPHHNAILPHGITSATTLHQIFNQCWFTYLPVNPFSKTLQWGQTAKIRTSLKLMTFQFQMNTAQICSCLITQSTKIKTWHKNELNQKHGDGLKKLLVKQTHKTQHAFLTNTGKYDLKYVYRIWDQGIENGSHLSENRFDDVLRHMADNSRAVIHVFRFN